MRKTEKNLVELFIAAIAYSGMIVGGLLVGGALIYAVVLLVK